MPTITVILTGLLAGLAVGTIAKLLINRDPKGLYMDMMLGIAGALLATWGGQHAGVFQGDVILNGIGAVSGAALLVLVYRVIGSPRTADPAPRRD